MVRHVVMFRFKEDASDAARQGVADGLSQLPAAIPEIDGYRFGPDLGLRPGNFDFVLVADFADADAFSAYVAHPAHQDFVRDQLSPAVGDRVSVQYEL